MIVICAYEGVVYHEYAPTGQTINKYYYVKILKRLTDVLEVFGQAGTCFFTSKKYHSPLPLLAVPKIGNVSQITTTRRQSDGGN